LPKPSDKDHADTA
jgi:erythrocyte band 7 integral membrane protein